MNLQEDIFFSIGKEQQMRYIAIERVVKGMRMGKSVFNSNGDILVNKEVILTDKLIENMKRRGILGVYVDDALSEDIEIEDLISDETKQKAIKVLKNMDVDAAVDIAEKIADEIAEIKEINLNMVALRSKDGYTYQHSLNVAVYSVVTGIAMGLRRGMLKELSAAALLHDIGKMQIPMRILDKPGKLTDEEYEEIKKHSEYGYELLKESHQITSKIKMGVYMHHENVDGTGYPLGLKEHQIYLFAQIIHIADVYDALSSRRSYKEAELPNTSVKFLMNHAGSMFQQDIVKVFIDCVPVYQKGREVILNTGEHAIVVENRQHHTMYPIIRLMDGTTIDLYEEDNEELEIVEVVC